MVIVDRNGSCAAYFRPCRHHGTRAVLKVSKRITSSTVTFYCSSRGLEKPPSIVSNQGNALVPSASKQLFHTSPRVLTPAVLTGYMGPNGVLLEAVCEEARSVANPPVSELPHRIRVGVVA